MEAKRLKHSRVVEARSCQNENSFDGLRIKLLIFGNEAFKSSMVRLSRKPDCILQCFQLLHQSGDVPRGFCNSAPRLRPMKLLCTAQCMFSTRPRLSFFRKPYGRCPNCAVHIHWHNTMHAIFANPFVLFLQEVGLQLLLVPALY